MDAGDQVAVGVTLVAVSWGWVASLWGQSLRTPQHLLVEWVLGGLVVGAVLLVGGARAAGAALVGSSVLSFLAYLLRGYYGGDHLETLVHGAVILGSVGLVVFGLAGLRGAAGEVRRRRALAEDFSVPRVLVHAPLSRYPMALALAFGTVVVGTLLIRGIDAAALRGFEDLGSSRFSRSTSPSSRCCPWGWRGRRHGHRGRKKAGIAPLAPCGAGW